MKKKAAEIGATLSDDDEPVAKGGKGKKSKEDRKGKGCSKGCGKGYGKGKSNPKGRGGVDLRTAWKDRFYTYLGMAIPGFPNLFMVHGPESPSVLFNMPLGAERGVVIGKRGHVLRGQRERKTLHGMVGAAR